MFFSRLRPLAAFFLVAAVAACAPRPQPLPPTQPTQPPPPRPTPPPPPPPATMDWTVAPVSPGDWIYRQENGASAAWFGTPAGPDFIVRCEPGRQISLTRVGRTAGAAMTFRTSSGARSLAAVAAAPPRTGLAATLPVFDPLLDDLVFSRGRFVVEAPGAPMLIVPAWPEPARVIEDCRG